MVQTKKPDLKYINLEITYTYIRSLIVNLSTILRKKICCIPFKYSLCYFIGMIIRHFILSFNFLITI